MTHAAPSQFARTMAPRFGIDPDRLTAYGAFESEVVHGPSRDGERVLKIHDPRHRTPAQVQAELDWLLALREAGAAVLEPLPSLTGTWTELVVRDGNVVATAACYRKVSGRHLRPTEWDADLRRRFGTLLGHLHAQARAWTPPGPLRPDWRDADTLDRAAEAAPDDVALQAALRQLLPHANTLTQRLRDVGTIHADAHTWNLLVREGGACTLIDFDDAVRGPYLYDLAVTLYYAVATRPDEDAASVAEEFLAPFLEGFDRVAPRPDGGADEVATLLAMRQADLAVAVRLTVPEATWTEELRRSAQRLRSRTIEGYELVPRHVLRAFFDA